MVATFEPGSMVERTACDIAASASAAIAPPCISPRVFPYSFRNGSRIEDLPSARASSRRPRCW